MTPTIIAVATIVAIITIIAVVATPVIITTATASASATTPALGIGANSDFKIKITGHITEHVTPDIIHEVKFVVTAIVSMPTIPVVIVVPRHVPGDSG